jgi:DDE superfamily endonuclease
MAHPVPAGLDNANSMSSDRRKQGSDGRLAARRPDGRAARRSSPTSTSRTPTKPTTFSAGKSRTLFSALARPGRMHDQTAVRTEGIAKQQRCRPGVRLHVDEGYRGPANQFPDKVTAPPRKPKADAPSGEQHARRYDCRRQSSDPICVEHANAEYKQWRPLQRYTGRRQDFAQTQAAIAGLVRDRSACRATRHTTSKELVLAARARPTTC